MLPADDKIEINAKRLVEKLLFKFSPCLLLVLTFQKIFPKLSSLKM